MLGKTKFEIKVLVPLKVIDALIFHLLAQMLGEHTLKEPFAVRHPFIPFVSGHLHKKNIASAIFDPNSIKITG